MLFKSQVYTQVSGSIGGITYSHNLGGLYTRARRTPVNPRSAQQQTVRDALTQLAASWSQVLTQPQRDAWKVYATNQPLINRLGDSINVPPLAMYIRCNVPRLQTGLPRVDDAPTIYTLPDFTLPVATVTAPTTLSLAFEVTDDWVGEDDAALIVYASRGQSPGINFFAGPFRYAGSVLGNLAVPPTSPAAMTYPFTVAPGNACFLEAAVSRADGRLSSRLKFRDIAA
jgi:hypothetical protein